MVSSSPRIRSSSSSCAPMSRWMAYPIGHLPGSINIRDDQLEELLSHGSPFPSGRTVVFVCPIGEQSRRLAVLAGAPGRMQPPALPAASSPGATPAYPWRRTSHADVAGEAGTSGTSRCRMVGDREVSNVFDRWPRSGSAAPARATSPAARPSSPVNVTTPANAPRPVSSVASWDTLHRHPVPVDTAVSVATPQNLPEPRTVRAR